MSSILNMIFRGPYWVPLLLALLLTGAGFALRYGFSLEAASYARLAAEPLPQPVAIDRYRQPRDAHAPQEAVLRAQIMTGEQIALDVEPETGAGAYFLPFTVPPGSAHEGEVMGGMILSRPARAAFVQWAVTRAHPRLANFGVEMTLAGLVESPGLASEALAALTGKGLTTTDRPVFLTPYMGRRDAVLGACATWVSDSPVTRLFFLAALGMLFFGINRFIVLRRPRPAEPEPLKGDAVRHTPFALLAPAEGATGVLPLAGAPLAECAARAAARARAMSARADAPRRRRPVWMGGLLRLSAAWLGLTGLGWLLSMTFPQMLGRVPLVLGLLSVPLGLLLRQGWQRRGRGGARHAAARGTRWEGIAMQRRLLGLRGEVRMGPSGGKA